MRVSASYTGLLLAIASLTIAGIASAGSAADASRDPSASRKASSVSAGNPGSERVGMEVCNGCHGEVGAAFAKTSHSRNDVDCEGCHGPGSAHAKGEDSYGKILKFGSVSPQNANAPCLECHAGAPALQNWLSGPHAVHAVRCTSCHRVHTSEQALGWKREANTACARCHAKQDAEESLPYHHPVREAKMVCADCHDPHGGTAANALREQQGNQLCFRCHAEFEGPFTYQHPPVTEDCMKCHVPHGSMHRHLLQVSEPMLCLQCHPGHHNGSGVPLLNACTNCHNSIHGSDIPSATGGSVFIDK